MVTLGVINGVIKEIEGRALYSCASWAGREGLASMSRHSAQNLEEGSLMPSLMPSLQYLTLWEAQDIAGQSFWCGWKRKEQSSHKLARLDRKSVIQACSHAPCQHLLHHWLLPGFLKSGFCTRQLDTSVGRVRVPQGQVGGAALIVVGGT